MWCPHTNATSRCRPSLPPPSSLKAEHHLQKPTPMGGGKRHSSAPSTSGKKIRPSPSPPLTAEDLNPVLSLVASAVTLSLRFLSDSDLLLLPSQTLSLESSLLSASLSLSRLLSLLHSSSLQSLQTLTLEPSPLSSSSSSSWFLRFLSSSSSHGSDPRWIEVFRMSKPSFYLLLQYLSPSLLSDPSSGPPDHKLGAALFRLAHAAPFRGVAHRFGLPSPAAACRAFYQVCKAVADQLGHLFELSSDLQRVVQGFTWMSLPNCYGTDIEKYITFDPVYDPQASSTSLFSIFSGIEEATPEATTCTVEVVAVEAAEAAITVVEGAEVATMVAAELEGEEAAADGRNQGHQTSLSCHGHRR